jgi:hypothetical protein
MKIKEKEARKKERNKGKEDGRDRRKGIIWAKEERRGDRERLRERKEEKEARMRRSP